VVNWLLRSIVNYRQSNEWNVLRNFSSATSLHSSTRQVYNSLIAVTYRQLLRHS